MRTFTTTHTVYKFEELSEKAQDKAIENLADINVDYEWWDGVYDDANTIGLKITSFDTYHKDITGNLTEDLPQVCNAIFDNHGDSTETYILAKDYMKQWDELVKEYSDGVHTDKVAEDNEDEFDEKADDMTSDFRDDLLQEYLSMLEKEYDYRTSRDAIVETINLNDYEFYEDGKLL